MFGSTQKIELWGKLLIKTPVNYNKEFNKTTIWDFRNFNFNLKFRIPVFGHYKFRNLPIKKKSYVLWNWMWTTRVPNFNENSVFDVLIALASNKRLAHFSLRNFGVSS